VLGTVQVGSDARYVDLTQGDDKSPRAQLESRSVSDGCNEFSGGTIGEGERILEPAKNKGKLLVEFSRPPAANLAIGETVDAEVKMTNTGDKPIEIPWSTDVAVIPKNQDPAHSTWAVGTFWFVLDGPEDHRLLLASTSRRLYGTKVSPASELTIPPGQNVRARVSFKIDSFYSEFRDNLKDGNWNLSAEWQQIEGAASLKECRHFTGYTDGQSSYFDERSPSIPVAIVNAAPIAGRMISGSAIQ
jgi:hypothetical protein